MYLTVIPASGDVRPSTNNAMRFVYANKLEARTIGVFSKCDQVQDFDILKSLMTGEKTDDGDTAGSIGAVPLAKGWVATMLKPPRLHAEPTVPSPMLGQHSKGRPPPAAPPPRARRPAMHQPRPRAHQAPGRPRRKRRRHRAGRCARTGRRPPKPAQRGGASPPEPRSANAESPPLIQNKGGYRLDKDIWVRVLQTPTPKVLKPSA